MSFVTLHFTHWCETYSLSPSWIVLLKSIHFHPSAAGLCNKRVFTGLLVNTTRSLSLTWSGGDVMHTRWAPDVIFSKSGANHANSSVIILLWEVENNEAQWGQNASVTVGFTDDIMFTDNCHSIKGEKHYLHSDRQTQSVSKAIFPLFLFH